jgi:TolB-like protein
VPGRSAEISPADARKIEEIARSYQGTGAGDIARLGAQIAQVVSGQAGAQLAAHSPLLAIPFGAPAGDPAARQLADSAFAQVYGRLAISHHGRVGLMNEPLASLDSAAAAERGREHHAKQVLCGAVDGRAPAQSLTVRLIDVADGAVLWSKSYPASAADPTAIAAQVDSQVTALEAD